MSQKTEQFLRLINETLTGGLGISGSVNVDKLQNKNVALGSGDLDNSIAVQRVCIASNDINMSSIASDITVVKNCVDDTNNVLAQNIQQVAGYSLEVGPGSNIGPAESIIGVPRVCIADDDTNLAAIKTMADELYDCMDIVNHHLEVDTNAINGISMAVNSGNLEISAGVSGVQRVCIATDDVNVAAINSNTSTVSGAVSAGKMQCEITNTTTISGSVNVNNFPATQPVSGTVNSNMQIAGSAVSTGNGGSAGIGDHVQRVVIANDDQILLSIDGNISGIKLCVDDSAHKLRVWSASGEVSVSGAVTLSGSSNAVNATCTGSVSLTGSTNNVNIVNVGGQAIPIGTGVTTNTIRTNLATDDVMSLNILNSLYDHRWLTTKFTTYRLGGTLPSAQLLSSKWCCIPNDSSTSLDETNTEPPAFSSISASVYNYYATDAADTGSSTGVTGAAFYYYTSTAVASVGTISPSVGDDDFSMSIWDVNRFYVLCNTSLANVGDIYMRNASGHKVWGYIPPGESYGRLLNFVVPIGNTSKVYLDSLECQSLDYTNGNRGFRVKIEMWVQDAASNNRYQIYKLFETQVNHLQNTTFDLSSIPAQPIVQGYSSSTGNFRYSIHLFVKGGNYGDGSSSPTSASCYLNCKVSR